MKEVKESPPSMQLISYQVGEVKALMQGIDTKFDQYRSNTDRRLIDLEKFQAAQLQRDSGDPKVDVQKIILAAFSLITTVVAGALWFQNINR